MYKLLICVLLLFVSGATQAKGHAVISVETANFGLIYTGCDVRLQQDTYTVGQCAEVEDMGNTVFSVGTPIRKQSVVLFLPDRYYDYPTCWFVGTERYKNTTAILFWCDS